MDTSEQYIKMCERAEKIQVYKTHRQTDMYLHKGLDGDEVMAGYNLAYIANSIWLPRQDQLQEMVNDWWKKNGEYGQPLIKGLYDFAMSYKPQPFRESELPINSWEQLWLAFVMKSLYSKVWNGEDWVNAEHQQ